MIQKTIPVWQKQGESTYRITNFLAQKYGVKATHTGVLDPMAEGVVIVLLDDERFKKSQHTDGLKEYEFEILFGISTDTYDGLGIIDQVELSNKIRKEDLEKVLGSFVGDYVQQVPLYSGLKVSGKKLFVHAKSNSTIPDLPNKRGKIHEIKLINFSEEDLHEKLLEVASKIQNVKKGEFRQDEILEQWKELDTKGKRVTCATIKVLMTRGLYVRSLSQDIAKRLNTPAMVIKLVRTKNGPYDRDQCIEICYTD